MSLEKDDPKLVNFFIFYSKFGQQEGQEHEKLLYYHPKSDSLDCQVRNIGLSEAITRFTNTFNKADDCESLHTQKAHQVFYQPEPSIWIVVTVAVGWVRRQKESGFVKEYHSGSVQDKVMKSQLIKAYARFKFEYSSFLSLLEEEGKEQLVATLKVFFDDFLLQHNLHGGSIIDVWRGVSFLPLDKQIFLKVHLVLALLQASVPSIVHTAFLFREHFAWYGFNKEDFKALSQYVTSKLSHSLSDSDLSSSNSSAGSSRKFNGSARFLGIGSCPFSTVYIRDDSLVVKPHQLVLYSLAGVTVCMSFSSDVVLTPFDFEQISKLLEGRISQLASDIGEQISVSKSDNFRFLYHNHMNLATKSSLIGLNTLSASTMQTILDMHQDLLREGTGDLTVKTASDFWIVGKSSNGRESYVILNHKNANLVEVSEEVEKLGKSEFNSIFMVD